MPLNKRGEFIPSKAQQKIGVEWVTFSTPYYEPYTNVAKVDVYMYGANTEYGQRSVIEGVSESVARQIAKNYRGDISSVRSNLTASQRTEYFKSDFFTRKSGRTGVLMENLANESGLAQVFKLGLKGQLSDKAQKQFDNLTFMVDKIAKIPNLADLYYEEAQEYFRILGNKYNLWRENQKAITDTDGFTRKDLKELEAALDKLVKITAEYYATASGYDNYTKQELKGKGVKTINKEMRTSGDFIESEKVVKQGRKLNTRNNKW